MSPAGSTPGSHQPPPSPPPDVLNVRVVWAAHAPSLPVDVAFPIRRVPGNLPTWEGSRTLTPAEHPSGRTIHVRWIHTVDPNGAYLHITCHPLGFTPPLGFTQVNQGIGTRQSPVSMVYVQRGVSWGVYPSKLPEEGILHNVAAKGGVATTIEVKE